MESTDRPHWLTIPAAAFAAGLCCLAMAVYSTAIMAYVVFIQHNTEHVIEMLLACFMYWWTGIALVVAGVVFWRGKLTAGLVATTVGVLTAGGFVTVLELAF